MKKIKTKAQQEMVGFVLIVILVTIIGFIFLLIFMTKKDNTPTAEVSNLLQAVMYYTSDCYSQNNEPKEVEDLINICSKTPEKICYVAPTCTEGSKLNFKQAFTIDGHQGPYSHIGNGGNAQPPTLVTSNLKEGDYVYIKNLNGQLSYKGGEVTDCAEGAYPAMAGFYDQNNKLIEENRLIDFSRGIRVPAKAKYLYAYAKESDTWKGYYHDNGGSCSFSLMESVPCVEPTRNTVKVCDSLKSTLTKALDDSLRIGDLYKNKGYQLDIYYRSVLDKSPINNLTSIKKGIFTNCSSIEMGTHTITVGTSGSGGIISVDLVVCKSMGNNNIVKEETLSGKEIKI